MAGPPPGAAGVVQSLPGRQIQELGNGQVDNRGRSQEDIYGTPGVQGLGDTVVAMERQSGRRGMYPQNF